MERARWKTTSSPDDMQECVIVNIPSYHLWAMRDAKNVLDMRIGCGSRKTKTPLLHSKIMRMDINPQWTIPGSIKTKELAAHAGNGAYFDSHNYYARNRKTGQKLTGNDITWNIIMSREWSIVQKGGIGNSLGRIIFRFENNFSVFLHDTSSRGVFARENRSVSHGCIRVERPFDLAAFMLRDKDDDTKEKIRYSMETDINSEACDKSKLIHSIKVEPEIPLFIEYYTIFPTPGSDKLQAYPDVYGYDNAIEKQLKAL